MLFNVYYDETHFPYLDKIKYIVNETTKEKLTLDEFIAAIPTFDEVNHIGRFNVFYPFLEKRLIADGFICKTTKTDYYSVYRSKLAPHSYVADITIKLSAAESNKNVNKMRIRGLTGEAKYLISFDAFTNYQEVNTPFPEEEVYYSSFLNQIKCKSSSPAGAMREDVPDKSVFKYAASIERDFCMDLINSMTYPAVIEAYAYGHFDEAYSYDVISMYPAMLSKIKHLPALISARKITEHMIIPENCFGWHRSNVRYQRFEVRFGGEPLEPGDWYVPAVEAKNSLGAFALKLFEDKQRYKEQGGPIYRFYKQKVNSFIGCFAQKNRSIIHLSRWDDTHGRYDKETTVKKFPRYDIFQIITAMARRYISELMNKAVAAGCRILKVNTDGFITDKPIPESMLGENLGDLRFEGKLTNLIIFSGNRHVADGEQSISGLPESMYVPGVYNYVYYRVVWSSIDKTFILQEANVNLLDEMEDYLNEER